MRKYWLRIIGGALGIFVAGMLLWKAVGEGRRRVVDVVQSDRPITIPLAFVPFTLDGSNLGTLSRVEIQRTSPEQVSAVNFTVKLSDSVPDGRLATCVLVAKENLDHINPGRAFTCVTPADTVGRGLAPVGRIETQRGGVFVLLAKAGTLEGLKLNLHGPATDSARTAAAELADSARQAAREVRDSMRREIRRQVQQQRRAESRAPATP